MITKIKELRVKIDGISQLVEDLQTTRIVDLNLKRNGESIEDFTKRCKEENLGNQIYSQIGNLTKAKNSLYLAKGWLGKLLGELGTENPYGSGYKTKEDIRPTADVKDLSELDTDWQFDTIKWTDSNSIERLDWLRSSIEEVCKQVKYIDKETNELEKPTNWLNTREKNICRTNSWTYLCEAKMWLGFELGRIRDEK